MLITDAKRLRTFDACHRIWQGIPGVACTRGGKVFVSFYSGGTTETYGNYAVVVKQETDGTFSEPIAAAYKSGDFRCFDSGLWIDPIGRLWFYWNVMPGEEVYASVCDDPDAEELVWGEEFYIGRGVMMNKPLVLTSGEWLFPIAFWRPEYHDRYRRNDGKLTEKAGSYVYKTSDNGRTFHRLGMSDVRDRSFDEHMVIEQNNGVLKMLVRTNYGIGCAYSYDRGKCWSSGENSGLEGPCSRFFIGRLRSGRLLLVNHVNFNGRNNLTALLSEDDGETFPYSLLLDERNEVSYPDVAEGEDGSLYIAYDRERGCEKRSMEQVYACAREILIARVTEDDIIAGELVSDRSFVKGVVSKLGVLSPEDADPFCPDEETNEQIADKLLECGGDIIARVFERYPIYCVGADRVNFWKLDEMIDRFYKSGNADRPLLVRIVSFLRELPFDQLSPHPVIEHVRAHIEEHLTEDIAIADIAQNMNISTYYLSHLFKKMTGTTVVEYRNERRLTKAKQLLAHTDIPVQHIAVGCGFNSASYFTEIFTRCETISPSEYRKYHSAT